MADSGSNAAGDDARAVVATVHQPSPAAFAAFDRLILLARGRVVYFGPGDGVGDYFFTTLGFPRDDGDGGDAAAFALAVASGGRRSCKEGVANDADALASHFGASEAGEKARRKVLRALSPPTKLPPTHTKARTTINIDSSSPSHIHTHTLSA